MVVAVNMEKEVYCLKFLISRISFIIKPVGRVHGSGVCGTLRQLLCLVITEVVPYLGHVRFWLAN